MALELYSHNGPHWRHRVTQKYRCQNTFPRNFAAVRFVSLSCLAIWDSGCVCVQCIKRQTLANVHRAQPKPSEVRNTLIKPEKIAVRSHEKHNLLQSYVQSDSFRVFRIKLFLKIDGQKQEEEEQQTL